MCNLLVTGGAGFIDTNFVHYWVQRDPADRTEVLGALTYAGNIVNLDPVKGYPTLYLENAVWWQTLAAMHTAGMPPKNAAPQLAKVLK